MISAQYRRAGRIHSRLGRLALDVEAPPRPPRCSQLTGLMPDAHATPATMAKGSCAFLPQVVGTPSRQVKTYFSSQTLLLVGWNGCGPSVDRSHFLMEAREQLQKCCRPRL